MDKIRAKKIPIKGGANPEVITPAATTTDTTTTDTTTALAATTALAPDTTDTATTATTTPDTATPEAATTAATTTTAATATTTTADTTEATTAAPVASEVNTQLNNNIELKNNIAKIAKTVIDSILSSKNIDLEKKYADFINKNGSYKPGRVLNTQELDEEVTKIINEAENRIENITNKIKELGSLKEKIEKNLKDTRSILEFDKDNNPLDLNDKEKERLENEISEFNSKLEKIIKQLDRLNKKLKEQQQIIEDGEKIKNDAKQKFKINFNIGLKNSDIAVNLYYEKPKIKIEPIVEEDLINTISSGNEYIAFKKLDELGTKFIEKFDTLKTKKDLDFSDTLHVLKSKYVNFKGGSNYHLIIDFDIYIYLKIDDVENSPTKGKIIVDNFYFHINNDEVKGIIDPNLDTTDEEFKDMEINALPADGILDYDLTVNDLDSNMQTNIINYLEEMNNQVIVEKIEQPVVGGIPNRRTRKKKKGTKKRKYSNKKKSKVKRKTRQ